MSIDFNDYDTPEFLHHETRKSRRTRKCDTCKQDIERGESYNRIVAKFPGEKLEATSHHIRDCWSE